MATKNVLVVDDDEDILFLLTHIMRNLNFNVVGASNGVEATFKFDNQVFDLIITDAKMPKKDGLSFIQHIHSKESLKRTKPTPIILISGCLETYFYEIKNLAGKIEFLAKPFKEEDIVAKVDLVLKNENQATSVKPTNTIASLKKGQVVFNEGDLNLLKELFYLKSGRLGVYKKSKSGENVKIAEIIPGEIFGEMAFFLNDKNRSATVIAEEECVIQHIPIAKLEMILEQQPLWFNAIFSTVCKRLIETSKDLAEEKSKRSA